MGRIGFLAVSLFFFSGCAVLVREPISRESSSPKIFRGVFHVHTEFSGRRDSKASLDTVLKTARKARFDFVVVTDHDTLEGARAYRKGNWPKTPILIFGDEISAPDGHLIGLGIDQEPPPGLDSQGLVDWIHARGGWVVLAHPFSRRTPWRNWDLRGFDGFEIYNFGHTIYPENKMKTATRAAFLTPRRFLKSVAKIPGGHFERWEKILNDRPLVIVGAADAHLRSRWLGITPESFILYFQSVTMVVLSDELTESKVNEALAHGKSFMVFEAYGRADGFTFSASFGGQSYGLGETVPAGSKDPVLFSIALPREAEIRLIHKGQIIGHNKGRRFEQTVTGEGAYRVEVYLGRKIWIVSNTITLRP